MTLDVLVADDAGGLPSQPFPSLLYVATPSNRLWLGDAPLGCIASQIVSSSGATGHNVEYLLRLAEYMRACAPEADDDHLFLLESLVRDQIRERRLCLETLMGGGASGTGTAAYESVTTTMLPEDEEEAENEARKGGDPADPHQPPQIPDQPPQQQQHPQQQQQQPQGGAQEPRPDAFAFTSRVQTKKLRCLNI